MGTDSKIQWTHHTFNPVLGCAKVHAGCTNCYAEKDMAVVMRKGGRIRWGEVWQGGQRVVAADSTWKHPLTWARAAAKAGERRRVFCSSLSDVLEVPSAPAIGAEWAVKLTALIHGVAPSDVRKAEEQARAHVASEADKFHAARERLWPIIEDTAWMCGGCGRPCAHSSDTPHRTTRLLDLASVGAACEGTAGRCVSTPMGGLDFLLLTKRPENWPLVPYWARPLVWLGTSISDQETADEWVPRLLAAEGFRYRFLSVEPLVEPVDLTRIKIPKAPSPPFHGNALHAYRGFRNGVDLVIVGGESGPRARPCNVEWVQSIVRQCREAGVPCFVKQLGRFVTWPTEESMPDALWSALDASEDGAPTHYPVTCGLQDPKGGDWDEWPDDLRVRQFPGGES